MNRYLKISLIPILLSICVHVYLSLHYYQVNYNPSLEDSSCNINATFNCDTAALSPFAAIMGIPISILGGLIHVLLLLIIASQILDFTSHRRRSQLHGLWLSLFIAMVSIIMFLVSITQLSSYCIFCLATYFLSFITLVLLWVDYRSSQASTNKEKKLCLMNELQWKQCKTLVLTLLAIPALAFIFHRSLLKNTQAEYGKKAHIAIKRALISWKASPKRDFPSPPSLVKGPSKNQAKITVTEFADFLCSHCQKAAAHLKSFSNAHLDDIRFEFYNFPLSGCSEDSSDGHNHRLSCYLAKAVHCSGQQASSWVLHDIIFKNQSQLARSSFSDAENFIKNHAQRSNMNWDGLKSCMDLAATKDAILAQIEDAKKASVKSTPAIFVNGHRLPNGPLTAILSRIYSQQN